MTCDAYAKILNDAGHEAVTEHRFHPTRRWRFDLALPKLKIALEVEGLGDGRHQRTAGFIADMEKYNEAAVLGWVVVRVTHREMRSLKALDLLERVGVKL